MDNTADTLFQISVKGLFANAEGKFLMMQEDNGRWDFPGGRVQKGENLIDCLKRECLEETGLPCTVLDTQPVITYSTIDSEGRARLMVFYRITFASHEFKPSEECVAMQYYNKDEIRALPTFPQIQKLPDFLT